MSMWEFEDLTEAGVMLVASANLSPLERREFYANLYDLQDQFDCSYTHLRRRQVLMDAQFFFRIDVEQHPDYGANQAHFQAVVDAGKNEWFKLPDEPGYGDTYYSIGNEKHPEHDFKPGFYFDVRGSLWPKAVAAGLLTGDAAAPFERWSPDRLLAEILTLAASQPKSAHRHVVLKGYYGWMLLGVPDILEPLTLENAALQAARDLPEVREALAEPVPAPDDWVDERLTPRREDSQYHSGAKAAVHEWLMDAYPAT